MTQKLLISIFLLLGLSSFNTTRAQKGKQSKASISKAEVKFLDDIGIDLGADAPAGAVAAPSGKRAASPAGQATSHPAQIEGTSDLLFKYALLLNTEVEQVRNTKLFTTIDNWYGTPYQYGGTTRNGIDCSAFVQMLYSSCYGVSLPRTAREQFEFSQDPAPDFLKEGDLVFFNTTGGVSHVGLFLQNYKFVHASTTGVMISDLQESYWATRFIGAGRVIEGAGK